MAHKVYQSGLKFHHGHYGHGLALMGEKWSWIKWNCTWNPRPLIAPMCISGRHAHISLTAWLYFCKHWHILEARGNCLLNIFVTGIYHISLQNYCQCCQIWLVYKILFVQLFQPINMWKGTSINTVTKWQNDLNFIWIHCSEKGFTEHISWDYQNVLDIFEFLLITVPLLITAKWKCVRKFFLGISLLQSWWNLPKLLLLTRCFGSMWWDISV